MTNPRIITSNNDDIDTDREYIEFIQASMRFIRDVKTYKGGEKASEIVRVMSETLGKNWSNQIIYHLISSDIPDNEYIRITISENANKIERVKAIRSITGCTLVEAKDAYELLADEINIWNRSPNSNPGLKPKLELKHSELSFVDLKEISKIARNAGFEIV